MSVMSCVMVPFAGTVTSMLRGLKPMICARMVRAPAGTPSSVYEPVDVACARTAVRSTARSAPEMGAPVESTTLPRMVPTCACTVVAVAATVRRETATHSASQLR